MKGLIPDTLNSKLNDLVTECFALNRICDRGLSVLNVNFAMHNTEKFLHERLAHLFPLLADRVSEYQASRNNLTIYGATPLDDSNYATPLDFFEMVLGRVIDLEGSIAETMNIAKEEDAVTFAFLLDFIRRIATVTNQCLLLVDKAEQYEEAYYLFDHHIENFVIL